MVRRLISFVSVVSFLAGAAAAFLWTATVQRGVTVARLAMPNAEYRLICGHGVAQFAAVPFVRPTASPFSSEESTHLGCTLSRWTIEGRSGWAVSVPFAYLVAAFSIFPVMRLSAWLRRKRRRATRRPSAAVVDTTCAAATSDARSAGRQSPPTRAGPCNPHRCDRCEPRNKRSPPGKDESSRGCSAATCDRHIRVRCKISGHLRHLVAE